MLKPAAIDKFCQWQLGDEEEEEEEEKSCRRAATGRDRWTNRVALHVAPFSVPFRGVAWNGNWNWNAMLLPLLLLAAMWQ